MRILQFFLLFLLICLAFLQETTDTTTTTTSAAGLAATATVFSGEQDTNIYYSITGTNIDTEKRTTQADGSDIGQCTCDLIYGECDAYCCCDTECEDSTLKIWESLKNDKCTTALNSQKYCFNNELIHKINKRRGMKLYENDYLKDKRQICIEIDSSQQLLTAYHKEYDSINSEFAIADAVNAAKRKDYYQQLVRSSTVSTDIIGSDDLSNNKDCISGFMNPSTALKATMAQIQKITSDAVVVAVSSPSSTYSGSCKCQGFLRGLTVYVISGSQIAVDVYTENIEADETHCSAVEIEQWFEIKHVDAYYFEPSGRPGYQFGKPVLGGTQAGSASVVADKNWLFLRGKNKDGTCMTELSTAEFNYFQNDQINFGENLKYFCSMKFASTTEIENFCKTETLDSFQLFQNIQTDTAFGKFGSSQINAANDWIKIQNSNNYEEFIKQIAIVNLKCFFPMHQILIIFYKSVGYERARQYQITNAYLTYETTENGFEYDFYSKTSQEVEFQMEVKFINLDIGDLVIKDKQHTKLLPTIPNDILFPFLRGNLILSNMLLTIILFLVLNLFL